MGDFRDLKVWEKAHALTLAAYQATAGFPREEMYGLTSQIRRSSSSIPANIAEGCGRMGDTELVRFLRISMGSASELRYHLLLARDLAFLPVTDHARIVDRLDEVERMLASLIQRLKARD